MYVVPSKVNLWDACMIGGIGLFRPYVHVFFKQLKKDRELAHFMPCSCVCMYVEEYFVFTQHIKKGRRASLTF